MRGWPTDFPQHSLLLWTPYIEQAILQGAIGEESIRILLENRGFALEELPDAIFEVADMKLTGLPIFIDAKYFSPHTLEKFALSEQDYGYDPDLNTKTFLEKCRHKWQHLQEHSFDPATQLVILNLAGPATGKAAYYRLDTAEPQAVSSMNESHLTILSGVIQQDRPDRLTRAFQTWCEQLSAQIANYLA
jgi:hypothetical protein